MKTPMYQSTERLYLNSKGEVCSAGDPDKQSLLVPAGGMLPMADAVRYGLTTETAAPAAPAEQPAAAKDSGKAAKKEEAPTAKLDEPAVREWAEANGFALVAVQEYEALKAASNGKPAETPASDPSDAAEETEETEAPELTKEERIKKLVNANKLEDLQAMAKEKGLTFETDANKAAIAEIIIEAEDKGN